MKKVLSLALILFLLGAFVGCSNEQESSNSAKKIEYELNKTVQYQDIEFNVDENWDCKVDASKDENRYYLFTIDNPYTQIGAYNGRNASSSDVIFNLHTKTDDNEKIVLNKKIKILDNIEGIRVGKVVSKDNNSYNYCEDFTCIVDDYFYVFSISGDYENKDNYNQIMTDMIDTIKTKHIDKIDGYEYANFDDYNSYAEDNGKDNTPVYTDGEFINFFDSVSNIPMGTLQVSEGKWTIVFISSDRPSIKELENLYSSKTVRVFGYYTGFSDVTNQPCIFVDKVVCDGKEYTYDLSDSEEESSVEESTQKTESKNDVKSEKLVNLYSDDNIVLSYYGMENSGLHDDYKDIIFMVENKTNKALTFYCDTIVINGYSYNNVVMADEIAPNAKGKITGSMYESLMDDNLKSIGVSMYYADDNDEIIKEFTVAEKSIK